MTARPSEENGFICRTCGQHHAELPMSFGTDAPAPYYAVAPEEHGSRCELTPDLCVIDGEQRAEAAVIAWMRHHTTAYDAMKIARIKGKRRGRVAET